ncbi:MAG: thioredoxin-related protein [Sphingobacteriales bacterium]|jgi:thioredoxin-related protein
MKKLLFFLFLLPTFGQAQDKIQWVSVDELASLQAKEPKKVLMDVYTAWCGPCKMMMAQTFSDPQIIQYVNKHFYAVKFNAEGKDALNFKGKEYINENYDPAKATRRNGTHQFASIAAVDGRLAYPTVVYMDEKLNVITPIQGFLKADQITPILTFVKNEVYKKNVFDIWKECNSELD